MACKHNNFFTRYELLHGNFNRALAILFFMIILLNVLDIHSTYKVVESGFGFETNPDYQEVNNLDFRNAIAGKVKDIAVMMFFLVIFIASTEIIIFINNTHDHVLDHYIHHFTWYLKYAVFIVFIAINIIYGAVVTNNYWIFYKIAV